jgi:tellurite resistance protein
MNANDDVAREELARAHHLIWSTKRFRRKSGETVGRLIDRMKRLLEEQEATAVMEAAAGAIPARLRPSAFAIVADLLLADGKIDPRERKFLQRLAVNFNIRARVANHVIEAMLVKNHL